MKMMSIKKGKLKKHNPLQIIQAEIPLIKRKAFRNKFYRMNQ